MLPKLVITDIDGVWTDGGMYYDEQGNEWKKFNTSDSAGVLFLRHLHIPLAIITGERSQAVVRRARKLQIDIMHIGIQHKLQEAGQLCEQMGISLKEVAFIGDDLGDWKLLERVGFSAAPANAPEYIKKIVDYVTKKAGGEGAFREFVEYLLDREGRLEEVLRKHIQTLA